MSDELEDDGLDELSAKALHDLAIKYALQHIDLRFFLDLMEVLPVAEMAAGKVDEAVADVFTLRAHIDDITDSGQGEVAELLRPFYLDYLRRHHVSAPR